MFSNTKEEHKKHLQNYLWKHSKEWNNPFSKKIEVESEFIELLGLVLNQSSLKLQEHIISKVREFTKKNRRQQTITKSFRNF